MLALIPGEKKDERKERTNKQAHKISLLVEHRRITKRKGTTRAQSNDF